MIILKKALRFGQTPPVYPTYCNPRPKPHWEMITNHLDGDGVEAFKLSRDEPVSYELLNSWVIIPVTSTNSI